MLKKKALTAFSFVLLSSVLFTGCFSLSFFRDPIKDANLQLKRKSELGSPENSVLVYGCIDAGFGTTVTLSFFQANTEYPPRPLAPFCYTKTGLFNLGKKGVMISEPLSPGGRYKLYKIRLYRSNGQSVYDYTYNYGVQGSTDFDFIVPQSPGLYYWGTHKVDFSTGDHKDSTEKSWDELSAVETALSFYKGTAWEPLLQAKKEELKNAK